MRVPWIRVHGALFDKPVVTRLVAATHISEHEAVGVLVTFWSGVAAHANNGTIAQYPDAQLEKWARWPSRKRGLFAKWVRAEHQDAEGRVPEWDDYAGALEVRREKERQRLADKRKRLRNSTQVVEQQRAVVGATLQPARANDTERDETVPTEKPPSRRRAKKPRESAGEQPSWVALLYDVWDTKVGSISHGRLGKVLGPVVARHGVEAVVAAIHVYASPDEGPRGIRKVEYFAEEFVKYHDIAQEPLTDPVTHQPTPRMHRLMRANP